MNLIDKIIENRAIRCYSCIATEFEVSIDACMGGRIILDCKKCGFRHSLPLDFARLEAHNFKKMPIDFSLKETRR